MKAISDLTQHQKILFRMAHRKDLQEWFLPMDFMQPEMGDTFVGYEASARLSELATDYPEMIESRPQGKYKKRRVRWESIDQWLYLLPSDLRYIYHRAGLTAGIPKPAPAPIQNNKPTDTTQGKLFDIPAKPKRELLL